MATPNDRAILNCIINPLQPSIGEFVTSEDENIIQENNQQQQQETAELKEAKNLEKQAVQLAESGKVEEALEVFNQVIQKAPSWASGYNNRAQALRLLRRNEEAMTDLNNAINLSSGDNRVLCQALNQRAALFRLSKQEDEAKCDFEAAAKLGSQFAKQQLALMNPYAALCNKMLHDVFSRLQRGECTDSEKEKH